MPTPKLPPPRRTKTNQLPTRRSTPQISQDQIDEIIEQRLDRIGVRVVAANVGVSHATVTKYWQRFLDSTSEERRDKLERHRSENIARLDSIAARCRLSATEARDDMSMSPEARHSAESKHLNAERLALAELARIGGFVAPQQVELVGGLTLPDADTAREVLAKIDRLPVPHPPPPGTR